ERRIGMAHFGPTREQEGPDALLDPPAEAKPAFADDGILDGAHQERRDETPALAGDGHQLRHRRLDDLDRADVLPAPLIGQYLQTAPDLEEVSLLERAQQLVLVPEAGVEAAHRRARAARDLRDRHGGMALLLDQHL